MRRLVLRLDSPERTEDLGSALGGLIRQPLALWLAGDLGAGKTCLTRGIARGLDVSEGVPVTSPSYTLMNRYEGRFALNHFDLYRLASSEELFDIGFEEVLHGGGVTVIEWADRFPGLAEGGLRISMAHRGDESRSATIEALDSDAERLLSELGEAWPEQGEQP